MTSNHFSKILNNLFWFSLYILPIVLYVAVTIKTGSYIDFTTIFTSYDYGFQVYYLNPIYDALTSIFGPSGVLPLFYGAGVFYAASYMASVYLIHFIIDVILWLVRWAHDCMHKGGRDLWK